jgi:hypothetical protein
LVGQEQAGSGRNFAGPVNEGDRENEVRIGRAREPLEELHKNSRSQKKKNTNIRNKGGEFQTELQVIPI